MQGGVGAPCFIKQGGRVTLVSSNWVDGTLFKGRNKISRMWSYIWLSFALIFTTHIRRMGEGNIFSLFVSLHLGVPQSHVLSQILSGGYPNPGQGVSYYGYPPIRTGQGYSPGQVRMGYPSPRSGRGSRLPQPGQGTPPIAKTGVTPPPPSKGQNNRARTSYVASGMLLCSHRRTFLLFLEISS